MNSEMLVGILQSVSKCNIFKDYVKAVVSYKSGHLRELSAIVYFPTAEEERLKGNIGKYIKIKAEFRSFSTEIEPEKTKQFVVFYADTFRTGERCKFSTNYVKTDCTLISDVTTSDDVKGAMRTTFKVDILGKDVNVTSSKLSPGVLDTLTEGCKLEIKGHFKTSRHRMKIKGEPFEFDTFLIVAMKVEVKK